VHQGNVWCQETHTLHLSHEARPLKPLIEQWLMEGSDLTSAFEMRAIETDEITVLGEWSGKRLTAALVPAIHQFLIKGADGSFVFR
jgi:hypothetical protein